MLHNVLFKAKHIASIDNNIIDSLSLAAIPEVSTYGKHFSRASFKKHKDVIWNWLESFWAIRFDLGYQHTWPPPLDHEVQFIANLSCKDYTYSTARPYVSAISFQCKIHNIADITKNLIVSKLLEGIKKN